MNTPHKEYEHLTVYKTHTISTVKTHLPISTKSYALTNLHT